MQGFGYITPADGSKDVFVHQSAIYAPGFRSLKDGEGVEYTIETDEQGRVKAANVTGSSNGFVQGAPRRPFRYGRRGGRGGSEGITPCLPLGLLLMLILCGDEQAAAAVVAVVVVARARLAARSL